MANRARTQFIWLLAVVPLFAAGCVDQASTDGNADLPILTADSDVLNILEALAAARGVTFETDHGTIRLLLYEQWLPKTTAHFVGLVEAGFYSNTLVHRVVDDFVIQGGDPSGTGQLGSGQTVPYEDHPLLAFAYGALGLARDLDPDSGDSQWFIAEKPQPHLSNPSGTTGQVFGTYAMYGQVYQGMDVVQAIAAVPTIPGADRPIEDVVLISAAMDRTPLLDLLALPLAMAPLSGTPHSVEVVHPTLLFSDRPARVSVFVEPADGAAGPATVAMTASAGDQTVEFVLMPTPADPLVYEADVLFGAAGDWTATFTLGSASTSHPMIVRPWHAEYGAYDRTLLLSP